MKPTKAEPTDLDREAARLFDAAPGMRVRAGRGGFWARAALGSDIGDIFCDAEGPLDHCGWFRRAEISAIDTDDTATVGVMLAQVEGVRPGTAVTIVDRLQNLAHEPDRRFQAVVSGASGWQNVHTGPTRGAVLVEAMRALSVAS